MTEGVVIAGAGPNGLMLAGELALAGVRPLVLESRVEPNEEPKANAVMGQAVRLLDHRGLHHRLGGDSQRPSPVPRFLFGALPLDLRDLADNPLHGLAVAQPELERVLARWAGELGVEICRGTEVTGFAQDADSVTVHLHGSDGPRTVRTRYLVGCDGGHSTVRRHAGIAFVGAAGENTCWRAARVIIDAAVLRMDTAEVDLGHKRLPLYAWTRTATGTYAIMPTGGGVVHVSTIEWDQAPPGDDVPMTVEELRASLRRVVGVDLTMRLPADEPPLLRRRNGGNTRVAEHYQLGRVLLVGDAAHVHSAMGAPGLNVGLQDAANLGWKLAAQLHGWAPPELLATYQAERRPAAERVAAHTQAQTALLAPGQQITALRGVVAELFGDAAARRRIAALLAGIDLRYPTGPDAHPLTGYFAPELTVTTTAGVRRLAELARTGRPLLLDFTAGELSTMAGPWGDRVDAVLARHPDPPAAGLLMRPDGYLAWAGGDGLTDALAAWFGPPAVTPGGGRR
ncbi:FAD-dependent monooxygenase [Saccharopolyspora sp. K220]|uniref:FAD-dependent monooxygenase n=1 Tax=Saccharopolyspora soli TaxID=2926618 RepID=UPI001F56D359|nr:FAD-dependent monooxygenase [Saccharopolyspora soli]MCI2417203.1 FAD-dependent monooxygenase [Saccharopolyspora soli]